MGGAIGITFYYGKPIGLLFKISAYLLFIELCILWVQMVYVSALRDHSRLLRGFLLGVIVGVISAQTFALRTREVATMLLSVDIGFLLVIGFFGVTIREHFPTNGRDYYGFLEYFRRYPSLFLCGLMQALGLYVHSLVVWCGKHQLVVENTFVMAPTFDVPVFWAFLSILPALVTFVVFSETSFFEKYAAFYHAINSGGTWEAIKGHKQEMLAVLRKNLRLLVGSQMTIALLCLALGLAVFPKIGFGASYLSIFGTMVIGNFAFIIMYICSTILLYFDDRKGALFAAFVFATANGLFTGLVTSMGEHYYGIGFAGAAFLGLLVVLLRLKAVTTDLDYFTFCAQPVSRPQAK